MSTDPTQPTGLPTPDPAAGTAANQQAGAERDAALAGLADGSLTLADVFSQGERRGPGVAHMHVKAALVALPHIDDARADKILADAGVDPTHHLDQLGDQQEAKIIAAASHYADNAS